MGRDEGIKMRRMNRKRRWCVHGSMTVEITLLMPVIIGVLLFLFYTSYYLHDIAAYEKGIGTGLLRAGLEDDDAEAKNRVTEALAEIRLLGKWETESVTDIQKDVIAVRLKGTMFAREGLFLRMFPNAYAVQIHRSTRRINETDYVRSHRRK